MLFEVAGFLSGVCCIAGALWLMHRRDSGRVMAAIQGSLSRSRQRA